ncbi:chemotaxis protein CheW [Lutispora thermophila]|uniref:Purine-binding chemotaxis protein CheW n=1 Tax=Lutispora thermophila DSM 19022 TaxID=1122184 RepID=A0A1M6B8H3_9FIRM|nr:chemotaxis protein CheW [Lutispora thermophila]SHI45039.1 purine-binding chemotaxis protein CheW [Lutispora thermophila DSM 19022]
MAELQFVVFKLGNEEYGVNIMQVKEIVPYKEPVKVPNVPNFIEGIINLRSQIIPIVNLRKRFNITEESLSDETRIIVMNIDSKQVGFIVDDASEVRTINEEDIENPPEIIAGIDRKYITGIGKIGERILILLDLDKLFSDKEKESLEAM